MGEWEKGRRGEGEGLELTIPLALPASLASTLPALLLEVFCDRGPSEIGDEGVSQPERGL